jgi:hypothetical protein
MHSIRADRLLPGSSMVALVRGRSRHAADDRQIFQLCGLPGAQGSRVDSRNRRNGSDQWDLVRLQFLRRVVGQHRPGTSERGGAVGWHQIDKIDRLGGPAQFVRNDRPAAPGQRIEIIDIINSAENTIFVRRLRSRAHAPNLPCFVSPSDPESTLPEPGQSPS